MADDGSKKLQNLDAEIAKKQQSLDLDGPLLSNQEKSVQLLEHGNSVLQSNNDHLKELVTNWDEIEKSHKDSIGSAQEDLAIAKEKLEVATATKGIGPLQLKNLKAQVGLAWKGLNHAKSAYEVDKKNADEAPGRIANNNRVLEQRKEDLRLINEATAASEKMTSQVENALGAITGIGNMWKSSAMGSIYASVQTQGWSKTMDDLGKTVADTLSPLNIAGSLMTGIGQQTVLMVKAVDQAQSGFQKATGAGDAYNDVISDIYEDNNLAGVSFGDAAQAVEGLMGSMAGFGKMGEKAQAEWGGMAATMNELGVSVGDSGAFFTNATKVMGMNQAQTKALVGEMGGLAKELGTSLGPLMSEFNASMSDLAVYGDDAVGIFKRLKGASDVLGISIGSLVGSMKEMDTIQGAAQRAGTLNAVLQGQFLDTHELLNASVEERILMTRKAIDASGKDWESMGRAERQMVANAAGFSDMAEAAKFMTTSVSDLESSMNEAGEASGSFEEIEDKASKAQAITEKFSQAMESLAIAAGPIVTALSAVADKLAVLMDSEAGPWILGIVAAMVLLFYAVKSMAAIQATHNAVKAAGGVWTYFQAKATDKLADAQKKQGKAQGKASKTGGGFLRFLSSLARIAQKNVVGLLTLGLVFIMIGIGVAIAALGVAQLVMAFSGFSAGEILAISVALLVFGLTMVALVWILAANAAALATAGAGLLWFGFAVLVLAAAMVVLAYAFGMMVGYVTKLIPHMPALAEGLALLAPEIAWVALSIALIGPAGALAFIGFVAMTAGLVILAAGLIGFALLTTWTLAVFALLVLAMLGFGAAMLMIGKNTPAFATLLAQIDNLTKGTSNKVNDLADAIESVGDALSNISMPHALVLTMLLEEIGYVSEQAPKATPTVVSNIEKLVAAAAEYSEIKWSFFGLAGMLTDPFVNMLKAAGGSGAAGAAGGAGGSGGRGGPGASGGAGTTVVLELDGVVLGRTVEGLLNKRNKLKIAVD